MHKTRRTARAGFALMNFATGIAMIVLALNLQLATVLADSGGCGTAEEPGCDAGEACCGDVCFDPTTHTCDCDENVVPIPEE